MSARDHPKCLREWVPGVPARRPLSAGLNRRRRRVPIGRFFAGPRRTRPRPWKGGRPWGLDRTRHRCRRRPGFGRALPAAPDAPRPLPSRARRSACPARYRCDDRSSGSGRHAGSFRGFGTSSPTAVAASGERGASRSRHADRAFSQSGRRRHGVLGPRTCEMQRRLASEIASSRAARARDRRRLASEMASSSPARARRSSSVQVDREGGGGQLPSAVGRGGTRALRIPRGRVEPEAERGCAKSLSGSARDARLAFHCVLHEAL